MADSRYAVDYGNRKCKCQKCKQPIDKGLVRIAKLVPNIFNDEGGDMKQYHHPACLFESFKKVRSTTKIIEEPGDLEGWSSIKDEDKQTILSLIKAHEAFVANKKPSGGKAAKSKATPTKSPLKASIQSPVKTPETASRVERVHYEFKGDLNHKDNTLREFRRLVASIADISSYLAKTEIVRKFFEKGSDHKKFQGDLHIWVRLLLPGVVKRIYNLQSKQLIKIFSRIFITDESEMLTDLEQGDVAETISKFFEDSQSKKVQPAKKATLTIHQVDDFLDSLTALTKEEDQFQALSAMATKCTINDLKMVIRLIKGDLRMTAGAKHILDALHPEAHEAFNSSRQVGKVVAKILELREAGTPKATLDMGASLMTPVQPMLAMACKSVDMAFEKCPNGMYSEIKYDGERVQLHKDGKSFKYFSRSLKPVLPHKVAHFKDHIPKAFPDADSLILDAEVLMVDNNTGDPLPFGSLGVHKAAGFKDATPCLFVFDCLHYNGQNLISKPIKERRKMLHEVMVEVGNNVKFSEACLVTKKAQLATQISEVLKKGLEGLVVKDLKSTYEPGKRHWLKIKKDYLNEGQMADSADLVVLGAWYGSGQKGGLMSIFLMGCRQDKNGARWKTVTKVHTGHDDETLERLQKELAPKMTKIKGNFDKVPDWLDVTRQMVPDFITKDPKDSPVWEITGAEFSKAEIHTAGGISIRFPRCTKIRDDKTWETATSLEELKVLYEESKNCTNINLNEDEKESPPKVISPVKRKLPESTPENSPVAKRMAPSTPTAASSPGSKSPIKKIKVENDKTSVTLGASGRSFDKVGIKSLSSAFELNVVYGDLFKNPGPNACLAHCISRDLKMSKGIAKIFRETFGRINELAEQRAEIGEVAILKEGRRFIYNLVTKAKYSDFPSYESLRQSLVAMKKHAIENKVKEIAMPKIGCGLDKLDWNAVRTLIKNIFMQTDVSITVYHFDKESVSTAVKRSIPVSEENDGPPPKKMNGLKFPMLDIAEGNLTPIIKTENGTNDVVDKPQDKVLKFKDLPNIFENDRIFLQNGINDKDLASRYVVAYGGEILDEDHFSEATLAVRASNTDPKKPLINKFGVLSKKKSPVVTEKWLWDSIKQVQRQSLSDYEI